MELLPAIDIRAGRCVRLLRGDFAAETIYGDPIQVALSYESAGARWVHVVDLDAAKSGVPVNRGLVASIANGTGLRVQAGGGIRDEASAEAMLAAGVERVVLGTAAAADPDLACKLAALYPGRIAVGIDHRPAPGGRREVAVRGWQERAAISFGELLTRLADAPFGAVVVTEIARDGTLEGPDLDGLAAVLGSTSLPVVASGGVGAAEHLRALAGLEVAGARLAGAIVGRAILSGAIGVQEALLACSQ
jgi:phosphoribosylformimino-5-aminoimidazole carboxamide ribotide isomerase